MQTSENCGKCGTKISTRDWFCTHCGKPRQLCPNCGSEFGDKQCQNCGTVRQAPCENCGRTIDITYEQCPNCDYNPSEELSESGSSFSKKGLALGGGLGLIFGGIIYILGSNLQAGLPDFLAGIVGILIIMLSIFGFLLGFLVGLPLLGIGLYRSSKAKGATPASLFLGRRNNESEEYKQKRLRDAAELADSTLDRLTEDAPIPSKCPLCGIDWSKSKLGSSNYEVYSNGNKVSCENCIYDDSLKIE